MVVMETVGLNFGVAGGEGGIREKQLSTSLLQTLFGNGISISLVTIIN